MATVTNFARSRRHYRPRSYSTPDPAVEGLSCAILRTAQLHATPDYGVGADPYTSLAGASSTGTMCGVRQYACHADVSLSCCKCMGLMLLAGRTRRYIISRNTSESNGTSPAEELSCGLQHPASHTSWTASTIGPTKGFLLSIRTVL